MACSGAPGEACGGPDRLSLYQRASTAPLQSSAVVIENRADSSILAVSADATNTAFLLANSTSSATPTPSSKVGWSYEGCYVDGPGPRSLPNGVGVQDGMTNQKCRDACQARGYVLAGTEYAGECKSITTPFYWNC
jgi:hypothetical protein